MTDLVLVSWAVSKGLLVHDSKAHLVRPDKDWLTLCGVAVPYTSRPSTDVTRTGSSPFSRTFPNSARETAALDPCKRCAHLVPKENTDG